MMYKAESVGQPGQELKNPLLHFFIETSHFLECLKVIAAALLTSTYSACFWAESSDLLSFYVSRVKIETVNFKMVAEG